VRHIPLGLVVYTLFYGIVLQPGCVMGYFAELLRLRKRWGTK
jgi:biofilm PGA synthesis N-glycosyltransferase PgaC